MPLTTDQVDQKFAALESAFTTYHSDITVMAAELKAAHDELLSKGFGANLLDDIGAKIDALVAKVQGFDAEIAAPAPAAPVADPAPVVPPVVEPTATTEGPAHTE